VQAAVEGSGATAQVVDGPDRNRDTGSVSIREGASMHRLIILLAALGCSGCAAAWGGSYNVAFANSNAVSIEYDPAIVNVPALLRAAQAECERFGRDAVLDGSSRGNLGIIVNTYRCEPKAR
jgi:hypothetical protein